MTEWELFAVIARPYLAALIAPATRRWMEQVMAAAEPVTLAERITACRDPADDKFLEAAVNGRADLLLTGDRDLLILDPFRGIPILTPASFVATTAR